MGSVPTRADSRKIDRTPAEVECFGVSAADRHTLEMIARGRKIRADAQMALLILVHALACRDCCEKEDADAWLDRQHSDSASSAAENLQAFVRWADGNGVYACWRASVARVARLLEQQGIEPAVERW